ncbi:MAG: ATP-binding protein [Sandaracinaceae bacterium]|nr:ATP-binding protein [Sandaracinaceae bacterium]
MPTPSLSPLVGRAAELERLMELREGAKTSGLCVRLLGESGVGKSRLLAELGERLVAEGDAVMSAGPHPTGAPVPYWPIRQLVRSLLDVDDAKLEQIAKSEIMGDPVARAGIGELIEPRGLEGCRASRAPKRSRRRSSRPSASRRAARSRGWSRSSSTTSGAATR